MNSNSGIFRSLLVSLFLIAWAQMSEAYPTLCKPSAGANWSCISPVTTPYAYLSKRCTPVAYFPSESSALSFLLGESTYQPPNMCNLQVERFRMGFKKH